MKIIAAFCLMILHLAGFAQKKTGRLEMLDPYAFQTKLIHMLGTLVDLRTPQEYEQGTIKGARNIEWDSDLFFFICI